MARELVDRVIFIHEEGCSCSDCCAVLKNEFEQFWFDVEGGEGRRGRNHIRRAVKRIVKNWAVMSLALGPNSKDILRELSVQLTPTTTAVLAFQFQHGKLVFARPLIRTKLYDYKTGFEQKQSADGNLVLYKTSLSHSVNESAGTELGWPLGLKGASRAVQVAQNALGEVASKSKLESSPLSWPFCAEVHSSALGWPLRKISSFIFRQTIHESEPKKTYTGLPERSVSEMSSINNSEESYTGSSYSDDSEKINEFYFSSPTEKFPKEIHQFPTSKPSGIILFSYEELRRVTSNFSQGNLVGMGGSSSVYKGSLPSGKLVAVKIFRSYKEACEDFFTEINITSSLCHKHIVPLAGVCLDQDSLMSVYDLVPQGSLEEHLHGHKRKPGLPWEARFKIAVAVADALRYLHNECPRPVIHRDVTSSNILLSSDFQPQLSDFGLAMRGQTSENTQIVTKDVLGTFGYIAPEYFMHGKVSDKTDVYAYGVVLLELLSGRRPVNLKAQKGHESLVKWAKKLIDCGELGSLLDPKLGNTFDAIQIHTLVLAAYFCTSQTAEHRPTMNQICKFLKGEISVEQLIKSDQNHLNEEQELWSSVLKIINDSPPRIRPRLQRRRTLSDCLQECDQQFTLAHLMQQEDQ